VPNIIPEQLESFLAYVRERKLIQQRREAGAPFPWTDDPVLRSKKFCCVLRDDDRTSREAKAIILALPEGQRLGAALGFRLYNRVSTLEALRDRGVFVSGSGDEAQVIFSGPPPVINATAYKISVKGGLFNLKTIASMVALASRRAKVFEPRRKAELTCQVIRGTVGSGAFVAYQTMQDLRWILGSFDDEGSWCILGKGATRACARLLGLYTPKHWTERTDGSSTELGFSMSKEDMVLQPKALAFLSLLHRQTPDLNMFDLEHNLCEWDKLERVRSGEGENRSWKPKPLPAPPPTAPPPSSQRACAAPTTSG
jgi:hypothetical protein